MATITVASAAVVHFDDDPGPNASYPLNQFAFDLATLDGELVALVAYSSASLGLTLTLNASYSHDGSEYTTPVQAGTLGVAEGEDASGAFQLSRSRRYLTLDLVADLPAGNVIGNYSVLLVANSGLAEFMRRQGLRQLAKGKYRLNPDLAVRNTP